jgi:hypothetical protein
MLTKEKSSQKRKSVNNQNNSSLLSELFPVINTKTSSSLSNLVLYLSCSKNGGNYNQPDGPHQCCNNTNYKNDKNCCIPHLKILLLLNLFSFQILDGTKINKSRFKKKEGWQLIKMEEKGMG